MGPNAGIRSRAQSSVIPCQSQHGTHGQLLGSCGRMPRFATVGDFLVHVDDSVRSELEAHLGEHPVVLDLPVDRLRKRGEAIDPVLEMAGALGLHVPVAAAQADAQCVRQLVGHEAFELVAPAGAVFRNRPAEVARLVADAQPVSVGAVHPGVGHDRRIGAEAPAAKLVRRIDAEADGVPVVVLGDALHLVRDGNRPTNVRVERDLGAAEGTDGLIEIVKAAEHPDPEVGAADHVVTKVEARVDGRAILLRAQGRRIRRDRRREILVLEVAVAQRAAADIALQEPTTVELETAKGLGREDRHAAVGQPRHHEGCLLYTSRCV